MPDRPNAVQTKSESDESLGELLRSRALASSSRLLVGQAIAGAALNVAVLVWHPERWGIATAALATVALHALWSLAVQRTNDADAPSATSLDATNRQPLQAPTKGWWQVRRTSAIAASASALLMLWFVCMMLLGRLTS